MKSQLSLRTRSARAARQHKKMLEPRAACMVQANLLHVGSSCRSVMCSTTGTCKQENIAHLYTTSTPCKTALRDTEPVCVTFFKTRQACGSNAYTSSFVKPLCSNCSVGSIKLPGVSDSEVKHGNPQPTIQITKSLSTAFDFGNPRFVVREKGACVCISGLASCSACSNEALCVCVCVCAPGKLCTALARQMKRLLVLQREVRFPAVTSTILS